MASNPMQRQARVSFLLGVVITLIIAAAIIALLYMKIKNLNEEIEATRVATKSVYVLNQDIKSGQVITTDMFTQREVRVEGIPGDATSNITQLMSAYSLCDKAGNDIYTKADGSLYMKGTNNNDITVYREEKTGSYYTQETNGEKKYIETTQKALVAKVDMKANTVLSSSFITREDEVNTDDVREQEYNMLVLPIELMTDDYIDVRLALPNGQDYIIISKKKVTVPMSNGEYVADTIKINVPEQDILAMSCAIVEAYKIEGSKLYVTKYTDAGLQEASTPTYVPNNEVLSLMHSNPNIVNEAKTALAARYDGLKNLRSDNINSALSKFDEEEDTITDKVEESITSTIEARQEYLQSLISTTTTTGTTTE